MTWTVPLGQITQLHHGPGPHPGTGTPQSVHGRGGRGSGVPTEVAKWEGRHLQPSAVYRIEEGIMVNPDGQVVFFRSGTEDTLIIPPGSYKNHTFSHYHPPGVPATDRYGPTYEFGVGGISQPFSASDMVFAAQTNLKEIRIIGWNKGKPTVFRAIRQGASWPDIATYWNRNMEAHREVFRNLPDPLQKYDGIPGYSFEVLNSFWRKAASELGFTYEVTYP